MESRFSRQGFLGGAAKALLGAVRLGIVGLGGGGSHVCQQFAHIGLERPIGADPDKATTTNSNRLVGASWSDIQVSELKAQIAEKAYLAVNPAARPFFASKAWQEVQMELRESAAIIGCVDSIGERSQIEAFARRFLIPYIDIGMDVYRSTSGDHSISGQVVLSMPGGPCLRCMGIVTNTRIAEEAHQYGAAGPRPQVVWPNGVLASTAVGIAVQLLTPWHSKQQKHIYLEYNGNTHTLSPSPRLDYLIDTTCPHFDEHEIGDPYFLRQLTH